MNNGYIKSLDGVRAIAILLVMSFHANLNHFGWMGVQLFFVLSGFLITGILWKEKGKEYAAGYKLKKFWIRRSLRIFPLYFGFLLFIGIIYVLFQFPSYFPTYIPYLGTYIFNYTRTFPGWEGNPLFTHFWSLSIEEQFYFFFPFIVFFTPKAFVKAFMISVIFLSPVIRFFLFRYYNADHDEAVAADAVYWHTLSHLDAFFMGGLIPVLALDKKIKRPQHILLAALAAVLIAGFFNHVSNAEGSFTWTMGYGHGQTANYEYAWHFTLLDVLFASLILCLAGNALKISGLRKILETGWLLNIGKVSYGMYVFHWAVLVYGFNRLLPTENYYLKLLLFVPYVFTVYLVSLLSYRFYESWFIRLKDKFFTGSKSNEKKVLQAESADIPANNHS